MLCGKQWAPISMRFMGQRYQLVMMCRKPHSVLEKAARIERMGFCMIVRIL